METASNIVQQWILLNDPTTVLDLSGLQLTKLPKIPSNCSHLKCSTNQLTTLPELPMCTTLDCYNNQLTTLPELPMCTTLDCHNNQLTTLPELPIVQDLL